MNQTPATNHSSRRRISLSAARTLVVVLILLGALAPLSAASAQEVGSTPENPVAVDLSANALIAPFVEPDVWYQVNLQRADGSIFGLISLDVGDVVLETTTPADRQILSFVTVKEWPDSDSGLKLCSSGFREFVDPTPCGTIDKAGTFLITLGTRNAGNDLATFRISGTRGPNVDGFEPQTGEGSDEPSEPQAGVLIILDASGSMLRASGSSDRITQAKEATRTMLSGIEPTDSIGLRVYGHRVPSAQKADACLDSELVVPVGPNSVDAMLDVVDNVQALGETPIGYSLEQARSDLGEAGGRIVLVSDGIDECFPVGLGPDPCEVAAELAAEGFGVVIDTIGFEAGADAGQQLRCIAEATGGTFTAAADGAELGSALESVGKAAALEVRSFVSTGSSTVGSADIRGAQTHSPGVVYRAIAEPGEESLEFRLDVPAGADRIEMYVQVDAHERTESGDGNVFPYVMSGSSTDICEITFPVSMVRKDAVQSTADSQVCRLADEGQPHTLRLQYQWNDPAVSLPVPVEFRYIARDEAGNVVNATGTDPLIDTLFTGTVPQASTGALDLTQPGWQAIDGAIETDVEVVRGDRVFAALTAADDDNFKLTLEDPAGSSGGCSETQIHSVKIIDGQSWTTIDCVVESSGKLIVKSDGGARDIAMAIDTTNRNPEPIEESPEETVPSIEDDASITGQPDPAVSEKIPASTSDDPTESASAATADDDGGNSIRRLLGFAILAFGLLALLSAGVLVAALIIRNRA